MGCPTCNGPVAEHIGTLGELAHFRCRSCGMIFSVGADRGDEFESYVEDEEDEEDEELSENKMAGYAEGGWREWGE